MTVTAFETKSPMISVGRQCFCKKAEKKVTLVPACMNLYNFCVLVTVWKVVLRLS